MENILIVDGYNMIGAWKELRPLKDTDLEEARNRLLELMAEYKAAMGWRVIVVFRCLSCFRGREIICTKCGGSDFYKKK